MNYAALLLARHAPFIASTPMHPCNEGSQAAARRACFGIAKERAVASTASQAATPAIPLVRLQHHLAFAALCDEHGEVCP
jgi:hypothetical protein